MLFPVNAVHRFMVTVWAGNDYNAFSGIEKRMIGHIRFACEISADGMNIY